MTGNRAQAAILALALAAGVAHASADVRDERRSTRAVGFASAGTRTVDVRLLNGSIRLTGDGGSDVRIESIERYAAETAADLRTAQERLVVDARQNGAAVEVVVRDGDRAACDDSFHRRAAWWDRRRYEATVDLTIRVPRDVRVRLCALNGPLVSVSDTNGDFDIDIVNGRVALERVGGAGRVTTVNGDIEAVFAAAPRAESVFKTVNGSLTVTYPEDLSADLRMKTLHGDLLTDFETQLVPPTATARGRILEWGQRVSRRSNGFGVFRVGAGGPALTFEVVNGDVRVLKAAR